MSQSLEEKIKDLQRELAVKNAYLSVQFSFPKGNKLPEDVRIQVVEELKAACAQLAEDPTVNTVSSTSTLSEEDVKILKELANTVKSRANVNTNTKTITATAINSTPTKEAPKSASVLKATLLTLENVPRELRNKVDTNSQVYVKDQREGRALVTTPKGNTFHIPVEDLEFEEATQ